GAAREIARNVYFSVRELHGAVNRVLAVQQLENRLVTAKEVVALLSGLVPAAATEFGEFLEEVSGTMADVSERLGEGTDVAGDGSDATAAGAGQPAQDSAGVRD